MASSFGFGQTVFFTSFVLLDAMEAFGGIEKEIQLSYFMFESMKSLLIFNMHGTFTEMISFDHEDPDIYNLQSNISHNQVGQLNSENSMMNLNIQKYTLFVEIPMRKT